MKNQMKQVYVLTFLLTSLQASLGCSNPMAAATHSDRAQGEATVSRFDVNKYALNKVVCDPLGGGTPVAYDQGLHAQLFSLKSGAPVPHNVGQMVGAGALSTQDLFFSQIFVPTRLFNEGFPTQTGGLIQNDAGQTLIEYFGLRFEGGLRLGDQEDEGDYELALLSDDGAILSVSTPGAESGFTTVVQNDGDHPTQMGCGQTLTMTHGSQFNLRLDYYQGPRYHIALIPMWRKVSAGGASEPLCGQSGNALFFDYNNHSAPLPAYSDLLARGWKPLTQDNFRIPDSASYNPCATGTVPVISSFQAAATGEGYAHVTWTTDIPSTTQVLYTDLATSIETMTTANNLLTTAHSVFVPMAYGHSYNMQGVSISADLGKSLSAVLLVK